MIELTRLNGHPLILNAELIKFVEQNPDTVLTLLTGDKLVVRETACKVARKVLAYRRSIHPGPPSSIAYSHLDCGHDSTPKE